MKEIEKKTRSVTLRLKTPLYDALISLKKAYKKQHKMDVTITGLIEKAVAEYLDRLM